MAWDPIFAQHPRDTYNEFRRLAAYLATLSSTWEPIFSASQHPANTYNEFRRLAAYLRTFSGVAVLTDLVFDTFDDATADMGGATPVPTTAGNNWVEQKRNWAESGGRCAMAEAADGQLVVDSTVSNCTVEADLVKKVGGPDAFGGLIVRNVGLNDCLIVYLESTGTDFLGLDSFAGGNLASANTPTLSDGVTYHLAVVILDDNIKCYLDGILYIDHTLSGANYTQFPNTLTEQGLVSGSGDAWGFDNFQVSA